MFFLEFSIRKIFQDAILMIFCSFFLFRRKKKCIRYKEAESEEQREIENHVSDDNLGSCGSVDEAQTPEDDNESLNQSLSSPGCLSGLSSLQSPSTSLASPINLLASPSTPLHLHHDATSTMMDMNIPSSLSSSLSHTNSNNPNSLLSNLHRKQHENFQQHHFHAGSNHSPRTDTSTSPALSTTAVKTSLLKSNGSLASINTTAGLNTSTVQTSSISSTGDHKNKNNCNSFGKIGHSDVHIKTEPMDVQQRLFEYDKMPIVRNPVGANPRDINNPLSVNQLTKRDYYCHNTATYLAFNINHALAAAAVAAQNPAIGVSSPPGSSITTTSASSSSSLDSKHFLKQHQDINNIIMGHPQGQTFQSIAHNFHNLHSPFHYQLAAAAAASHPTTNNVVAQSNKTTGSNQTSSHHRDDGNAISVT